MGIKPLKEMVIVYITNTLYFELAIPDDDLLKPEPVVCAKYFILLEATYCFT